LGRNFPPGARSLDFELGGDIAPLLFRVSEFCHKQLDLAFCDKTEGTAQLTRARSLVRDGPRTGWQVAAPGPREHWCVPFP
jgi:hypothetical protein